MKNLLKNSALALTLAAAFAGQNVVAGPVKSFKTAVGIKAVSDQEIKTAKDLGAAYVEASNALMKAKLKFVKDKKLEFNPTDNPASKQLICDAYGLCSQKDVAECADFDFAEFHTAINDIIAKKVHPLAQDVQTLYRQIDEDSFKQLIDLVGQINQTRAKDDQIQTPSVDDYKTVRPHFEQAKQGYVKAAAGGFGSKFAAERAAANHGVLEALKEENPAACADAVIALYNKNRAAQEFPEQKAFDDIVSIMQKHIGETPELIGAAKDGYESKKQEILDDAEKTLPPADSAELEKRFTYIEEKSKLGKAFRELQKKAPKKPKADNKKTDLGGWFTFSTTSRGTQAFLTGGLIAGAGAAFFREGLLLLKKVRGDEDSEKTLSPYEREKRRKIYMALRIGGGTAAAVFAGLLAGSLYKRRQKSAAAA